MNVYENIWNEKGSFQLLPVLQCHGYLWFSAAEDEWSRLDIITLKRAHRVEPARQKELDGTVTAIMRDHGYIDGEVILHFS